MAPRNTAATEDADFGPPRRGGYGHAILIGLIVIMAFAARYWFNFIAPHINNYGAADASEYLRNAQALYGLKNLPWSFWSDCWNSLSGHADVATIDRVRESLAPLKSFYMSGPIFPLFLVSAFAIAGAPFDPANWSIPLFAQSVVSALTCGFVAGTAAHAFSKPTGYLAGLIAAFYPAFIVNSGRLYTETFAAFLLSIILYSTVRGLCVESRAAAAFQLSFVNGLAAAALQLTRSIMVIVSVALLPLTFIQYGFRKGVVAVIGLLLGYAVIALPWMAFQKLAFGSASLVIDRVGHYNLFVGNNADTAGWLSLPYPDGRGIEQKPLLTLLGESVDRNPRRWAQLMADKPLRLLKFPCNDFRTAIGPITFSSQVLFHQVVMVLSFIGIVLGLAVPRRSGSSELGYERVGRLPKDPLNARLFLMFVLGLHLAYLFFITVPRYNITAMPVLIIFAAAGVTLLARSFTARGGTFPAVSIVFAAALLFAAGSLDIASAFATAFGAKALAWGIVFKQGLATLAVICLGAFLCAAINALSPRNPFETRRPLGPKLGFACVIAIMLVAIPLTIMPVSANGRWYEWKSPLDERGQRIAQEIRITTDTAKSLAERQVYLMVDADGARSLNGVAIDVNGVPLNMPIIPSISLVENFERTQLSRGVHMREGEWIFSCMTEAVPMVNADLRQWFLIPLPPEARLKPGLVNVGLRKISEDDIGRGTVYGAYPSDKKERRIPALSLYSWEKAFYGVENPHGLSDPRYDTRIASESVVDRQTDLSLERGMQTGSFNIRLVGAPGVAKNTQVYTVEQHPTTPKLVLLKEYLTNLTSIQDVRAHDSVAFSSFPAYSQDDVWLVRCTGRVKRNSGQANLKIGIRANFSNGSYVSPWAPVINYRTEWLPFDFAVPFQPTVLNDLRDIQFNVSVSNPTNAVGGNSTASGITEVSGMKVQIMRVPTNPLHRGNLIL